MTRMPSYAIGILNDVRMGLPIVEYLERIDATLTPFGGAFIVHGSMPTILEGADPGVIVIIEFPDRARAEGWYGSEAYQAILHLRTGNSSSTIVLVDGVDPGHVATDVLGAGYKAVRT